MAAHIGTTESGVARLTTQSKAQRKRDGCRPWTSGITLLIPVCSNLIHRAQIAPLATLAAALT
jgi:hypothetical protein